jgi:1,4-alpha-glucan branching enzyme
MGDSPEAQKAWQLQQKLLQSATENAKKEALQEFQQAQDQLRNEQKQFEQLIDDELESLEDEYNVDLTSKAPAARKARREFLELVQNLSPKDENGAITGYADFDSTFQLFQKTRTQEKPNNTVQKQKEIASKTMQQPAGAPTPETPKGPMNWNAAKSAISRLIN